MFLWDVLRAMPCLLVASMTPSNLGVRRRRVVGAKFDSRSYEAMVLARTRVGGGRCGARLRSPREPTPARRARVLVRAPGRSARPRRNGGARRRPQQPRRANLLALVLAPGDRRARAVALRT